MRPQARGHQRLPTASRAYGGLEQILPRRNQRALALISDFWPPDTIHFCCLSHHICCTLFKQPRQTNKPMCTCEKPQKEGAELCGARVPPVVEPETCTTAPLSVAAGQRGWDHPPARSCWDGSRPPAPGPASPPRPPRARAAGGWWRPSSGSTAPTRGRSPACWTATCWWSGRAGRRAGWSARRWPGSGAAATWPPWACAAHRLCRETALRHRERSGISGKRAWRLFNLFRTAISPQQEAVTWSRTTNT